MDSSWIIEGLEKTASGYQTEPSITYSTLTMIKNRTAQALSLSSAR